jgi:hypothetical protein
MSMMKIVDALCTVVAFGRFGDTTILYYSYSSYAYAIAHAMLRGLSKLIKRGSM